jgi:protein-tyrosine phosphatase
MIRVLFVCLGNICRSPMAEGLFIHQVQKAGLENKIAVDSCGTGGWHVGEPADRRMRQIAQNKGVHLPSRARKVRLSDFEEFDYILAMDDSNLNDLQKLAKQAGQARAQLFKMRFFDPEAPNEDVPDPYWGGERGFEEVYEMLDRSSVKLLDYIREEEKI